MATKLYIVGATLDQVRDILRHATDAHDPLNFFTFDRPQTDAGTGLTSSKDPIVQADKRAGVDAAHYAKQLEDRLRGLGLPITVTTILPRGVIKAKLELLLRDGVVVLERTIVYGQGVTKVQDNMGSADPIIEHARLLMDRGEYQAALNLVNERIASDVNSTIPVMGKLTLYFENNGGYEEFHAPLPRPDVVTS